MNSESPNYLAALLMAASVAKPGVAYEAAVLHDKWCALLKGTGVCNCNPEVHMRELKS